MTPLDSFNPLTPFWLLVTTFFEVGLGLGAYLGVTKVLPFLKERSAVFELGSEHEVKGFFGQGWQGKLAEFAFRKILHLERISRIPRHPKWFLVYWFVAVGGAFLTLTVTTGLLITSVGWVNPLSLHGFVYDLIYARSNAQPNGAHLPSFLGVVALAWVVAWKYRNGFTLELFAGLLAGAFLVAVHEGLWIIFYYASYAQYLDWSQLTSVLKDVSFSAMIILLLFAFKKYPYRQVNLRIFLLPTVFYLEYLILWFAIPHLVNPSYYHDWFPITTLNNYKYGKTVYAETDWYADPLINLIEVGGWLFLAAGYIVAVLLKGKPYKSGTDLPSKA